MEKKSKSNSVYTSRTDGEALGVIFEAEVEADHVEDKTDNDETRVDVEHDTHLRVDNNEGDVNESLHTEGVLANITDADVAAAHPWMRDVFFLGALPSDEDLMLPIASLEEETDIKEMRDEVDFIKNEYERVPKQSTCSCSRC